MVIQTYFLNVYVITSFNILPHNGSIMFCKVKKQVGPKRNVLFQTYLLCMNILSGGPVKVAYQ